ncbi:MAG: four helix bundle protein [Desulfobaccales bacterium]
MGFFVGSVIRLPFTVFRERKGRNAKGIENISRFAGLEAVKEIYKLTNRFPNSEVYGLTSQIRRAAVSIPSNIAEGQGRNSQKEFRQFLSVAVGSLAELETQLIISKEIDYLNNEELDPLLVTIDDIREMIRYLALTLK